MIPFPAIPALYTAFSVSALCNPASYCLGPAIPIILSGHAAAGAMTTGTMLALGSLASLLGDD